MIPSPLLLQALVQRLQKADGSEGGSDGNVIAEMSAEADKLRLQVRPLGRACRAQPGPPDGCLTV
jgi:hypothetical protein